MNKPAFVAHDATHLVPGVPSHSDAPAAHRTHVNARSHSESTHVQNHGQHHQNPPQVLIAWQNWIGRLVGRSNSDR